MKIFKNDFTVYSDMESDLMKLKCCFQNLKNIESVLIHINVFLWYL
jgi:hypothetical protein